MLRTLCLVAGLFLHSIALAAGPILIDAEQYGDAWPFTLEEVHLTCMTGDAVVVMDPETGQGYPVNGNASARSDRLGLEPLEKIWRTAPDGVGVRVSVGPIIQAGLKLCH